MGKIKNLILYSDKISKDMNFLIVSDMHLTSDFGYSNLRKISFNNYIDFSVLCQPTQK